MRVLSLLRPLYCLSKRQKSYIRVKLILGRFALSQEIVLEGLGAPTVFKDESKLDLSYVPPRLPHRETQYRLLTQVFRCMVESPGGTGPRAIITGGIGTGKTALAQRFGSDLEAIARSQRGLNLRYVHVNCHGLRGSFFLVLTEVLAQFITSFPRRGFGSEELLRILMRVLDDEDAYVILTLDEAEALIRSEGSNVLYSLTRVHETRTGKHQRLGLVCIFRNPELLSQLEPATLSTLQKNFIQLPEYKGEELVDILTYRASLAVKPEAILSETVGFIADLCTPRGDARYAIELLLRSGKCADNEGARSILPEHVRKAEQSLEYPSMIYDYVKSMNLHEKLLLLAVVKKLREQPEQAYVTMGEAEENYRVLCEAYREMPRAHTQLWKYANNLASTGLVSASLSGQGQRGKTTNLGIPVPAVHLERALTNMLENEEEARETP